MADGAPEFISETAMGVRIEAQTKPESDYVKALYTVAELFTERTFEPHHWSASLFKLTPKGRNFYNCVKITHDFTMKVTKCKRC